MFTAKKEVVVYLFLPGIFGILFILFLSVKVLIRPFQLEKKSTCSSFILFLFCIFCSKSCIF